MLVDSVNSLQNEIRKYSECITSYDRNQALKSLPNLAECLTRVLPEVVNAYENPSMAEYKEDQEYWLMQLQRILDAFEKQDFFLAYDALNNELYANLNEFKKIISARGI